jgi:NAD(P)-dependent dehydrogenase (short-subunit alcohol dehydrogenase family)
MNANQKIAIVTGANRGLGFETCRQLARQGLQLVFTSRDVAKGKTATEKLKSEGIEVTYHPLDVTREESIEQLQQFIRQQFGRLDVLVNNAGIFPDPIDFEAGSIFQAKVDTLKTAMETNVYGPLQLCQAFIPLMKEHDYGRVVNVSSGMGQLSDMGVGYAGYRLSKTALNAVTRILAAELKDTNILVNSVCPGWVRTDMGGPEAPRTPEEGVETIVWLATLPDNGPTGGFFRDKQPIAW